MKASATLVIFGAAIAAAQSLTDLPQCGQTCVGNMIAIAQSQFKCATNDIGCYCSNVNFGYGVRDCSNAVCSPQDAAKVIGFGTQYCQNYQRGQSSAASGGASASASATGSMTGTMSGGASSTMAASSTPITTSPLVYTNVSNGMTMVSTTGMVTVYGQASATDSAASAASSAASSASASAASSASSAASNAASSAGSAASSARSTAGAAPMKTAAPLLGAAGMAAVLFL